MNAPTHNFPTRVLLTVLAIVGSALAGPNVQAHADRETGRHPGIIAAVVDTSPPWHEAKTMWGASALLLLGLVVWGFRLRTQPPRRRTALVIESENKAIPTSIPSPETIRRDMAFLATLEGNSRCSAYLDLDLRLLWFLGDETRTGLVDQIDRYIEAFCEDVKTAQAAIAGNDKRQIHSIAHRLVAHARAVKCGPLTYLAERLQAESAILSHVELVTISVELDREFSRLKNTLGELQISASRA